MEEVCRGGLERDGVARAVSDSTIKRTGPEIERGKARLDRAAAVLADICESAWNSVQSERSHKVPVKDVLVKFSTGWEQE